MRENERKLQHDVMSKFALSCSQSAKLGISFLMIYHKLPHFKVVFRIIAPNFSASDWAQISLHSV